MSVCKRYIKCAYTVTGHKEALFTRLRCKQWSCDHCASKNAKLWQFWLIKRLPEVSDKWWLVTLTAHSKKRTELASLQNLRNNIDRLIKRVRQVWGDDIQYVRVFERHPTSEAVHVHFIMSGLTPFVAFVVNAKARELTIALNTRTKHRCWSTKTWFKNTAQEMKMGYMADVRQFEGDVTIASFYVTKYLTKDQQAIDIPYLRHVQVTKGIGSPEFEKSYEWTPVSYITSRTFEFANTRVVDIDTGEVIDNQYWETKGFYPDDNSTNIED